MKKEVRERMFYWALCLVILTLPLPKYSLNSLAIIICFVSWVFFSSLHEKISYLKKQLPLFFLLSSFFWLSLLGLLYTSNMEEGLKNLKQNIPFLVFPLIFLSIKSQKEIYPTILKYFSISVLIAAVFALSKSFFFKINDLGDYFYFDQFSVMLDKHTTYFALFVIIAIIYFIYEIKWHPSYKNIFIFLILSFFLIVLYMISTRISVLALIIVLSINIFQFHIKEKLSWTRRILFMFLCLTFLFVYLTPNFQRRFESGIQKETNITDIGTRAVHWKAVINRIGNNENIFLGSGTGDGHDGLYEEYLKLDFKAGYLRKYNAHNQYLETTLFFGFTGLFLLLFVLFFILKGCVKNGDAIGFSIICVFMIFMITESVLERHSGIVLFSFFVSMISVNNKIIRLNVLGSTRPVP